MHKLNPRKCSPRFLDKFSYQVLSGEDIDKFKDTVSKSSYHDGAEPSLLSEEVSVVLYNLLLASATENRILKDFKGQHDSNEDQSDIENIDDCLEVVKLVEDNHAALSLILMPFLLSGDLVTINLLGKTVKAKECCSEIVKYLIVLANTLCSKTQNEKLQNLLAMHVILFPVLQIVCERHYLNFLSCPFALVGK